MFGCLIIDKAIGDEYCRHHLGDKNWEMTDSHEGMTVDGMFLKSHCGFFWTKGAKKQYEFGKFWAYAGPITNRQDGSWVHHNFGHNCY